VHCYPGFTYDRSLNECVLSEDLENQIESMCIQRIIKTRQDWADQECRGENEELPMFSIDELITGIDNTDLRRLLK
jgi:hypothetical protein